MSKPKENLNNHKKELLRMYYQEKEKFDHLWIDFDVLEFISDDGVNNLQNIIDQLAVFEKNEKYGLIVHINNSGGNIDAGFMLYNMLQNFDKPKITVNEFFCASAATFFWMAGDLRIIKPYSIFLIHQGRHTLNDTLKFKQMRRLLYSSKISYDRMIKLYQSCSEMPISVIKKYLRAEMFLPISEMIQYKMADHVFDHSRVSKFKPGSDYQTLKLSYNHFNNLIKDLIIPENIHLNKVKNIMVNTSYKWMTFQEGLYIINLMLEIPIPIDFVINADIKNGQYLMTLFGNKIYLIKPLTGIVFFSQYSIRSGSNYDATMEDNTQRTNLIRKMVLDILDFKTKLPKKILDDILYKDFDFTSQDAIKYKLVDKVVTNQQFIKLTKEKKQKKSKKKETTDPED